MSASSAGENTPILEAERLNGLLAGTGFRAQVLEETGSTMADLAAGIASGSLGAGDVVAALHQRMARGRLERVWTTPPNAALLFSVCLDAGSLDELASDPQRAQVLSRTPLVVGLAVVRALNAMAAEAPEGQAMWSGAASLKWPNDVHLNGKKAAGILCQMVPQDGRALVVAGVGLNVNLTAEQLPTATSTSLLVDAGQRAGADSVPWAGEPILARILAELGKLMHRSAFGTETEIEDLMAQLEGAANTLGQRVRAEMHPTRTGEDCVGTAVGLDADGSLVLLTDAGERVSISSGDIWHLRPASSPRSRPAEGSGSWGK